MNKDILSFGTDDIKFTTSDVVRAANVVDVQLGSLEYAQFFGADKRYFLESTFEIQNSSFRAYLVQRMMESQVNIINAVSVIENFMEKITFQVGQIESGGEFIR